VSIKAAIKTKIESVTEAAAVSMTLYYGHGPQEKAYPYAVLTRISGEHPYDQGGRQAYATEVFQLDLFDDSDADLETVRNGIIKEINGAGPVTWGSGDNATKIYACIIEDSRDLTELENEGGQTSTARQTLDMRITYQLS